MKTTTSYDAIVIGGGLAGLSFAILLQKAGKQVLLLEKETYPFHKVCGEYISLESWAFLLRLGVPLNDFDLPIIKKLKVTAPNGNELEAGLDLGGFGISRFLLDNTLKKLAVKNGVQVLENTKATQVEFHNNIFTVTTAVAKYTSIVCAGSFGKRSNLDIQWKRPFITASKNSLNNFIGVKYHINYSGDEEYISLHNFENGYCGISRIEDNKYCLCYLTTAANLKKSGNSIEQMEQEILSRNPHLHKILANCTKLYDAPLTISQVSFSKKEKIINHMFCIGDAAGMITPLCGNGMSMAMHSALLAAEAAIPFLHKKISREQMENDFSNQWNKQFSRRLSTGRMVQRFFGKSSITNLFIGLMKNFPQLTRLLVKATHGKPF